MYLRPYGGKQSADLDAVLRNNNITHYAKWPPTRTTSFRSCQTAAAATNKHWSRTSVLVIEEKLDTVTREPKGDGEGKERRSVIERFRWPVLFFHFYR